MSSDMYPKGLQAFLAGDIAWKASSADSFKVLFIDASYAYSAAHDYRSDVVASRVEATSPNLTSLTNSSGVADASSVTTSDVGSAQVSHLILFKDTSVASTSPLLAFYDTSSVTGLPLTPNSGDVTIQWHASGAFKFT